MFIVKLFKDGGYLQCPLQTMSSNNNKCLTGVLFFLKNHQKSIIFKFFNLTHDENK